MVVCHRPAPRAQALRCLRGISSHRGVKAVQLEVRGHELDGFVIDEVLLVLREGKDGLQETGVR